MTAIDPKFLALAADWIHKQEEDAIPLEAVRPLAALLSQVDAEATERAAKVCDRVERAHIDNAIGEVEATSMLCASVAGACAQDIRSTLPTPAARAGERPTDEA